MSKPKIYSDMELSFLEHLKTDAKGDIRTAMNMAGYSPTSKISDIQRALKVEIQDAMMDMLAAKGTKAVAALDDLLDNPNQLGAGNKLKTVAQILDRLGAVKTESPASKGPQGGIFILPPKEGSIVISTSHDSDEPAN